MFLIMTWKRTGVLKMKTGVNQSSLVNNPIKSSLNLDVKPLYESDRIGEGRPDKFIFLYIYTFI